MYYYSLNKQYFNYSFKDAVIQGLAPDNGLFYPKRITPLSSSFLNNIEKYSDAEIAFQIIHQFVGSDITEDELRKIIEDTLSFDFPIVTLDDHVSVLELFHGPTMAFKDVGARFMARSLGYFNRNRKSNITVLVATSGDTGGAVASGFLGVHGVNVVILYPGGKVSDIQERQLTTLGQNITALEVNGVFDDCQDMVKRAFLDDELTSQMQLTSANSINIARWLPQMFYFFFAYKKLKLKFDEIVFSVPSGNFGNICAGMMAQRMGLPVQHFIASNNANNVVTEYLKHQQFMPKPTISTISNAMDVGNPSNFSRILEIFDQDFDNLKKHLSSYSFSDEETREAIIELYSKFNYIADPHGAVGYLGAKAYVTSNPKKHCVFLETAHPAKFLDIVEKSINTKVALPLQIQSVMNKEKKSIKIDDYDALKAFFMN